MVCIIFGRHHNLGLLKGIWNKRTFKILFAEGKNYFERGGGGEYYVVGKHGGHFRILDKEKNLFPSKYKSCDKWLVSE